MTDQSRVARSRRGDRGPGWLLLTALLVLAILASSTLVFTNKVELLRLAVVLSLWAAVMAAFVTVMYRRQSDVAQARARDMKYVYDLQLEREIAARREYELAVETNLRRQLSQEVSAQAADEMAALRAELASLRAHLEVMLGADLSHRPALESERLGAPMPAAPGRVESSRLTVVAEEIVSYTEGPAFESAILDVPEEPLTMLPEESFAPAGPEYVQEIRGSHWRSEPQATVEAAEQDSEPFVEYMTPVVDYAPPVVEYAPAVVEYAPPVVEYAPPVVEYAPPPEPETLWRSPEVRLGRHATDGGQPEPEPPAPPEPLSGRHYVGTQPEAPGRHRGAAEGLVDGAGQDAAEETADGEPAGQHADGQSLSDLLSRFNMTGPVGGGGRRRRED